MVAYRFSRYYKGRNNSLLYLYIGDNSNYIICKRGDLIEKEVNIYNILKGVPGIPQIIEEGTFISDGRKVIPGEDCLFMRKYNGDISRLSQASKLGDSRCSLHVPFTLNSMIHHMVRLLTTLEIIHSLRICHNDIKLTNILHDDENFYLGDFDHSIQYTQEDIDRFFEAKKDYAAGIERDYFAELSLDFNAGTFIFASPESLSYTNDYYDRNGPVYPISDIWSLGCVFFRMLTPHIFNVTNFYLDTRSNTFSAKECAFDNKSPLEFTCLVTEDMNREGFSIYDNGWKDKVSQNDMQKAKDQLSPITALLAYQNLTRRGMYRLSKEENDHLRALFTGMLDPNFLTRLSAEECLQNPLFKNHLHIHKDMWDEYLQARDLHA